MIAGAQRHFMMDRDNKQPRAVFFCGCFDSALLEFPLFGITVIFNFGPVNDDNLSVLCTLMMLECDGGYSKTFSDG